MIVLIFVYNRIINQFLASKPYRRFAWPLRTVLVAVMTKKKGNVRFMHNYKHAVLTILTCSCAGVVSRSLRLLLHSMTRAFKRSNENLVKQNAIECCIVKCKPYLDPPTWDHSTKQ
jgi:hypothetical protein